MKSKALLDLGKEIQELVQFCDLKLVVRDRSIDVHKVVLVARSKYFATMLSGNFRETQQDSIDLTDSIDSPEALTLVINYLYTGSINITSANLEDVLAAANHLLLMDLKDFCAEFLFKNLTLDNCVRSLALADMYNMSKLYAICLETVTCRFKDYLQHSEGVLETPSGFMQKLVKAGAMVFMDPHEVRAMFLRWLEHSPEERHDDCIDILRCVNEVKLLDHPLSDLLKDKETGARVSLDLLRAELGRTPQQVCPFICDAHKSVLTWKMDSTLPFDSYEFNPFNSYSERKKGPQSLKIEMYFPDVVRWYKHEQNFTLPADTQRPREFVGFIENALVFLECKERLLLCCFEKSEKQWKSVATPNVSPKGCLQTYDGKIFHLTLDIAQSTADVIVHVLDTVTLSWKEECRGVVIPVNQRDMQASLQAFPTKESLYILVATHKLLKFVRITQKDTGYALDVKSQPFFRETSYSTVLPIRECHDLLVIKTLNLHAAYNMRSGNWEKRDKLERKKDPKPEVVPMPLINDCEQSSLDIDLDMAGAELPLKNCDRACLYTSNQGSKHLWVGAGRWGDPENFTWTEMTPPPKWASLHNMRVYMTPVSILEQFELYSKCPKDMGKSKLFRFSNMKTDEKDVSDEEDDDDDEDDNYDEDMAHHDYEDLDGLGFDQSDWFGDDYDDEDDFDGWDLSDEDNYVWP